MLYVHIYIINDNEIQCFDFTLAFSIPIYFFQAVNNENIFKSLAALEHQAIIAVPIVVLFTDGTIP